MATVPQSKKESKPVATKEIVAVHPETLIAQAIEKGLPVETMERLLVMRRELKEEWAREQYFQALMAFQRECPIIKKTKKVFDKSGKLRYEYAPIEDIVKQVGGLFEKHGFSYSIHPKSEPQAVTAICTIHHVSGHSESSEFTVPIDADAYMNAAQKVASALTYAKRYAVTNGFGILTGDSDDDAGATENDDASPPKKQAAPKATNGDLTQIQKDFLAEVKKLPVNSAQRLSEEKFYEKYKDDIRQLKPKLEFLRSMTHLKETGEKATEREAIQQELSGGEA